MRHIIKTKFHSQRLGKLSEGCRRCVKGEKLVLFVTGVCPAKCFYCPISEQKKQKDVVFANERRINSDADLIAEAKDCAALGAGITGGDPLARLERTCHYIKLLKSEFGSSFHIHLYTPLNLVTQERLMQLFEAGLDEIRFHPDILDSRWWERILLPRKYSWRIGAEIPVLPNKTRQTRELLAFLDGKIDFLNLNELEISDLNMPFFEKLGYHAKAYGSYGVQGSERAALALMREAHTYPIHYRTCRLKDLVQMGNRLKRRAKNTRLGIDVLDEDGMVLRGAIFHSMTPGYGYEKMIEELPDESRARELALLRAIRARLIQEFSLLEDRIILDEHKPRLLVRASWLKKHASRIKQPCAVVKEYPTYDSFPLELEFL